MYFIFVLRKPYYHRMHKLSNLLHVFEHHFRKTLRQWEFMGDIPTSQSETVTMKFSGMKMHVEIKGKMVFL